MNICLIEEEDTHNKFLLATLISIDFLYKDYNVLISCSKKTKEYILNFPLKYNGNINWLILNHLDDNNIRYSKNLLVAMSSAIELFGEALYIDCRINIINKINISEDIKNQGIGFISRSVGYMETNIEQKYITNLLYINHINYIDIIDNLYRENIEEWYTYSIDNFSIDELRSLNKKLVDFNLKLPTILKNKYKLDKFLPHETLISTEDFFAINDKLRLKDITLDWEIPKNLVKERNNNIDIKVYNTDLSNIDLSNTDLSNTDLSNIDLSNTDLSNTDLSNNEIITKKEEKEEKEEDLSLVKISCLNIRTGQLDGQIVAVNKEMYSRMANYNIIYMLLINLKYATSKIEFVVPKRDGIGIWNRTDDPPGLYELIDMITEENDYFGKIEASVDYFSFTNFIITDKPSHYWLNNNIRKYSGFFLCNYDDTLDIAINKINLPSQFGFYYSDYPKLLEKYSEKNIEKSRFCIEIYKNKIIEYELSKRQTSLHQKNIINISSPEEKLRIIGESEFVLFDNIDINLFANCFGLKAVPVLNNTCINNFKDKNIYMLNCDTNYILEPTKWSNTINNREIIMNNNTIFYNEYIVHNKVLNTILKNIFNICYKKNNL